MKKIPCLFLKDSRSQLAIPVLAPEMGWLWDPGTRVTWKLGDHGFDLWETFREVRSAPALFTAFKKFLHGFPGREGVVFFGTKGQKARLRRADYGFD